MSKPLLHHILVLVAVLTGAISALATSIPSYHYDSVSSGVNSTETVLTPTSVNTTNFFKRYSTGVDGAVYAQPLYMPSVNVTTGPKAGVHNLIFVATQHDSLYAIDADSGVIVWQTSFLALANGLPNATAITSMPAIDTNSPDTSPEIGICGTPAIDPSTNLLYLVAKTKQIISNGTANPSYVETLFKIDITNGNATANANIVGSWVIAVTAYNNTTYTYRTATLATDPQDPFVFGSGDGAKVVNSKSRVYFNAMRQMNRPAMVINGSALIVAFGSHGDNGPYHGWILTFDKTTLNPTGVLCTTPNAGLGGFWGGGARPALDANGAIYMMTGNGSFDGYNNNGVTAGLDSLGFPVNGNYGDSLLKIVVDPTTTQGSQNKNGWGLKVADYFAPFNNQALNAADSDLGSGGVNILPDAVGNVAHPHLLVGSGKQGNVYLVDRDNLGKFTATTDNVVQSQVAMGECFSTPAFFNNTIYYFGINDNGKAFSIANGAMTTTPLKTPDTFAWPGSNATISANGASNGVVWAMDRSTGQLRAYNAATMAEIWTSVQAANSRDALDSVCKFTTPVVADGRVLVGTNTALVVYGPPTAPIAGPPAPTALVATPISGLEIDLSWTDNSLNEDGFAIEQSSDNVTFTQIATVGVNISTYAVMQNLTPGATYYFRVRAFNSFNTKTYSAYSNTTNAATLNTAPTLNFANGFANSTTLLQYNSASKINSNRAEITDGGANETGSIWSRAAQDVRRFNTQFTFQITNPTGDGMTFAIQNNTPAAIGPYGGDLAYTGIKNSLAIKFDLYSNSGEGVNSTGLYLNGAAPTQPSTDLTSSGLNLHSGHVFQCNLTYDGTTLTEKLTDTVTAVSKTITYTVNIPTTIGSNTAYVGFTGGTGSSAAIQDVLTWTYVVLPSTAPSAPTNLSVAATSGTQINLTWTDTSTNEDGFLIMRKVGAAGTYAQVAVAAAGSSTYSDTALTPSTTYYYQVAAKNSVGTSAYTNEAFTTTPVPPPTPTNAQATNVTQTTISMSWSDNSTNETGYNIMRKATSGSNFALVAQLPPDSTTYTDTNLTPGTSYDYHIQAYNLAGYSDFSGFTASTLGSTALPIVTASATGPVAVFGLTSGQLTFTRTGPFTTSLPVTYALSGSATPDADYTALTGTVTIPLGAASANVTVAPLSTATANDVVVATVGTTATYTAGTPANGSVVFESPTFNATAGTAYGSSNVAGTTGNTVTLTFQGLPSNPTSAVYVWYLNGTAFATTTSPTYSITNSLPSQSGTYAVYAWGTDGTTGSALYNVTITDPVVVITPSVNTLTVKDGTSGSFTVSLGSAPSTNVTVNVAITGSPSLSVSPATLTMTPTAYQNQTVAVAAAAINSNDSNRTGTVTLTAGSSSATVAVTNTVNDTQTAATLAATTYPLTGSNIGADAAGAGTVHTSGSWWIDGSGVAGLSGTSDSFHFENQSYTGNFQMIVQLQNLVATGATTPRAGLMIRDGSTTGATFLALAGSATSPSGYALIKRTTASAAAAETITSGTGLTYTYPNAWLMLSRVGNILHAFVSSDGTTFTEITDPTAGVTWTGMSTALNIGVFSSSASAANTRAVMANFSIVAPTAFVDTDLGAVGLAGSAVANNGIYAITGSGADIWNNADAFNFYSEPLTGDNTIIVHVDSVQNTDPWAKAGVMFRNALTATSAMVTVLQNPNNNVEMQWRDLDGYSPNGTTQVGGTTATKWLKLVKTGNSYSGYYATTTATPATTDWVLIGTHTTAFPNATYRAGLAVTAHNNKVLNTSNFSAFSLPGTVVTPPPPPPPPATGYTDADIGAPGLPGSGGTNGNLTTLVGGGADIWSANDQFNFYYQTNTTDKTIIVHVDSEQNTDPWAKAGPMFRVSTAGGSAFVAILQNPGLACEMQWRDTTNYSPNGTTQVGGTTAAKWLKLVKVGNVFTGYYATTTATPAATDWILVGSHNTVFGGANYLSGLAVTAHNNGTTCTTVFSSLSQQ